MMHILVRDDVMGAIVRLSWTGLTGISLNVCDFLQLPVYLATFSAIARFVLFHYNTQTTL